VSDHPLDLSLAERNKIWSAIAQAIEAYAEEVRSLPVMPTADRALIDSQIALFDFKQAVPADTALNFVVKNLRENQLQIAHPAYFGVFNPVAAPLGVAGEWLAAAFNPQLASWTSSPFAIAVEQHLIRWWASRFGLPGATEGTFTSGGAEANHTAMLTALTQQFPSYSKLGTRELSGHPTLYVSKEAHHSFLKAARLCGLGTDSVREIAVDAEQKLRVADLTQAIQSDRKQGHLPFFIGATAGTTGHGAIDPLDAIATVARAEKVWFHVDAAWAGPAVLVPELKPLLEGIHRADSVTLDTHKWLNLPMTAGIFLTRHEKILRQTFSVDFSPYMPVDSHESPLPQPYQDSMSWSRRFQGLKLFLALACAGEEGYRETIRAQVALGNSLRDKLKKAGWATVNSTKLPVVCFENSRARVSAEELARRIAVSGKSWVTTTSLEGRTVLRAGISNYRTTEKDLDVLISLLHEALKN